MYLSLFLNLILSLSLNSQATAPVAPQFQGFIQVRPDRMLYVDYVQAKPGFPTLILLNGLTYSTRQYEFYARAMIKRGVGVLRFDFDGMGQSLLRYAPSVAPYPYDQQARDTMTLLNKMKIPGPYHFAGLSYGGGIGLAISLMYPRSVKSLLLIAPYTEPLESQDKTIKSQIAATRIAFPMNPATDDELYDFFLRQNVYSSYPMLEPIILENPYKLEAVYNLVRGIRKFNATTFADRLPAGTIHLMIAATDQYIPNGVLNNFWNKINPSAKMNKTLVYQTEHKIPEVYPEFVAKWSMQVLKGNPLLSRGRSFEAWPLISVVKSGNQKIPLED
jgi:pimeloyl-ACP methyl ester carboxylesterase